jgi:5-methylcytosine-specific restriction endonuclease McrA
MAKSSASKGYLVTPRTTPNESEARRKKWLADAAAGFVTTIPVNKVYHSVLLDALWPARHGIPGPILTRDDLRAAVDEYRKNLRKGPYKDPFRRVRELQGEEGFHSIIQEGVRYQLQSLDLSQKREPRAKLGKTDWKDLKERYGHKCASCGKQEPDVKLSPDHKVPRNRNGSNDLGNWQPLCEQCNNIKSNVCRGCELNCHVCSWAFPDDYKQLVIADDNKARAKREADRRKIPQSDLVNKILRDYFNREKA